jgi:hypothetical protein
MSATSLDRPIPKLVGTGRLGTASQMSEIFAPVLFLPSPYRASLYLTFFKYTPTDQTDQPIRTFSGSNNAVWVKDVPFKDGIDTNLHLGAVLF